MNIIKHFIVTIIVIAFVSCRHSREAKEVADTNVSKTIFSIKENQTKEPHETKADCFNLLFDLIKSSDFSFESWELTSNDFDIYVDEETSDFIRIRLIDRSEKQTIGWLKYYKETNKLFDESANLETPLLLSYDKKLGEKLNDCLSAKTSNPVSSISSKANEIKTIGIPLSYSYDLILEEHNFSSTKSEFINGLDLIGENQKIGRLISQDKFSIYVFINYLPSGQSEWYLISLDRNQKLINKLLIYTSQETEKGTISTTFNIDSKLRIQLTKSETLYDENNTSENMISESIYTIDKDGLFRKN